MDPLTPEQAEQIFPAECHFKIITHEGAGMADRLNAVLIAFDIQEMVAEGNRSAGGKYVTYNVSITIQTIERMREIDAAFRDVDGVRMVL